MIDDITTIQWGEIPQGPCVFSDAWLNWFELLILDRRQYMREWQEFLTDLGGEG